MARIEIKHNFTGETPTGDTRVPHVNGTRIRNNSLSAEKFNRYAEEIEQIAEFIGDIPSDSDIGSELSNLKNQIDNFDTNYLNPSELSSINKKGVIDGVRDNLELSIYDRIDGIMYIAPGAALLDTKMFQLSNTDTLITLPEKPTYQVGQISSGLLTGTSVTLTLINNNSSNVSFGNGVSGSIKTVYNGTNWYFLFYNNSIVIDGVFDNQNQSCTGLLQIIGDTGNFYTCDYDEYYSENNMYISVIKTGDFTPGTVIKLMFKIYMPAIYFIEIKDDENEVSVITTSEISHKTIPFVLKPCAVSFITNRKYYTLLNRENDINTLGLYSIFYNPLDINDNYYNILDLRRFCNKETPEELKDNYYSYSKTPFKLSHISSVSNVDIAFKGFSSIIFEPVTSVQDNITSYGTFSNPNINSFVEKHALRLRCFLNKTNYEKTTTLSFNITSNENITRTITIPSIISPSYNHEVIFYVANDGDIYLDKELTECYSVGSAAHDTSYPFINNDQNPYYGKTISSSQLRKGAVKYTHQGFDFNVFDIDENLSAVDPATIQSVEFIETDTVICNILYAWDHSYGKWFPLDDYVSIIPIVLDGCFPISKMGIKILDHNTIQLAISSSLNDITSSNLHLRLQIIRNYPKLIRGQSLLDNINDHLLMYIESENSVPYFMNLPYFDSDVGINWSLTHVDPMTATVYSQLTKSDTTLYDFSELDSLSLCDIDVIYLMDFGYNIYKRTGILPTDELSGSITVETNTNPRDYIIIVSPKTSNDHSLINKIVFSYTETDINYTYPIECGGTTNGCEIIILRKEAT